MAPCCLVEADRCFRGTYQLHYQRDHPEDGGGTHICNVGLLLQDYTASNSKRLLSSYSQTWEPEILHDSPALYGTQRYITVFTPSPVCVPNKMNPLDHVHIHLYHRHTTGIKLASLRNLHFVKSTAKKEIFVFVSRWTSKVKSTAPTPPLQYGNIVLPIPYRSALLDKRSRTNNQRISRRLWNKLRSLTITN
jgi:hypothetical protein